MDKNNSTPRKTKVSICNLGCGLRGLDGARLENYFRLNGCIILEDPQEADINILVSCSYKKSKEDECFDRITELNKHTGMLVVVGCLSGTSPTRLKKEFGGEALSPKNLDQIDRLFPSFRIKYKEVPDTNVPWPRFGYSKEDYEELPPIIRIADGCLGQCAYCAIRFATGKLRSKSITACVEEYKALLEKGHKCIVLNAEDIGFYGQDSGSSLPELLNEFHQADHRPDIYWKLFSLNPNHLIQYKDELMNYVRLGRIVDLDVDIQSGNQRILEQMNRPYEMEEILEAFHELRKANPNIYLRTILLVGFPSETDEEFLDTLSATKQLDLDYMLVIPYSDRELTPASKMPNKIPASIIENRMEMAKEYFSRENFLECKDDHLLILMKSGPPYEPEPIYYTIGYPPMVDR